MFNTPKTNIQSFHTLLMSTVYTSPAWLSENQTICSSSYNNNKNIQPLSSIQLTSNNCKCPQDQSDHWIVPDFEFPRGKIIPAEYTAICISNLKKILSHFPLKSLSISHCRQSNQNLNPSSISSCICRGKMAHALDS